jgi:hypothetical protein
MIDDTPPPGTDPNEWLRRIRAERQAVTDAFLDRILGSSVGALDRNATMSSGGDGQ